MEDEGNHGNDETRLFILSSLAQHHKSRISCVLCEDSMLVFDRYPLVDGTFFLSPKRHTSDCIEVNTFYLNSFFFFHSICFYFIYRTNSFFVYSGQIWRPNTILDGTLYGMLRGSLNWSYHSMQVSSTIYILNVVLYRQDCFEWHFIYWILFIWFRRYVDFALQNGMDRH